MNARNIAMTLIVAAAACLAASDAVIAQSDWLIGSEIDIATFSTDGGTKVKIAIPGILSSTSAKDRLLGTGHKGSLLRDAVRRERYAESIRQIIFQPGLPVDARTTSIRAAMRTLASDEESLHAIAAFVAAAPVFVDASSFKRRATTADVRNRFLTVMRRATQLDKGKTHTARLSEAAPWVSAGDTILGDFLLYKALTTDAAQVRLAALQRILKASYGKEAADSALTAALQDVEREFIALQSENAWATIADTLQRNRASLVSTDGRRLSAAAIDMLDLAGAYKHMLGAEIAAATRLAEHYESAQLAVISGTIAWRFNLVPEGNAAEANMPAVRSPFLYAQFAFAESLHASAKTARDASGGALPSTRPYADVRSHYRSEMDAICGRLAGTVHDKGAEVVEAKPEAPPPASKQSSPISTLMLDLGRGVKMELVQIPAGEFLMGSLASEPGREAEELPQHRVRITNPFYMAKFEVTQDEWQAVMGDNPSSLKNDGRLPVENVSWNDCQDFCKKLSKRTGRDVRLPTEAEWEYACRAGGTERYSFGSDASAADRYAWYRHNADFKPHPVGGKEPNAWGLYDMHGNLWEWCADWYGPYSDQTQTDPKGASSGADRVLRGGSLLVSSGNLRCANRFSSNPDQRHGSIGLRVVVVGK